MLDVVAVATNEGVANTFSIYFLLWFLAVCAIVWFFAGRYFKFRREFQAREEEEKRKRERHAQKHKAQKHEAQ